jgi:hypothetical protein
VAALAARFARQRGDRALGDDERANCNRRGRGAGFSE